MDYGEALKLIGGLSKPSKMPGYSWSISAEKCITGAKLAEIEGTVCSGCYALKGNYRFSNVKEAQERRLAAVNHPEFVTAFVKVLTETYGRMRKRETRFRWLDAGDLQNVSMLEKINEIARQTPQLHHWLPTRELKLVREFLRINGQFSANLVVRVSANKVGERPNRAPFGLPLATVGRDTDEKLHQCPALLYQDGKCLDCNICWTSTDVNYPVH